MLTMMNAETVWAFSEIIIMSSNHGKIFLGENEIQQESGGA